MDLLLERSMELPLEKPWAFLKEHAKEPLWEQHLEQPLAERLELH